MAKVKKARTISCFLLSSIPKFPKKESAPSTTISIAIPMRTGGAKSKSLLRME